MLYDKIITNCMPVGITAKHYLIAGNRTLSAFEFVENDAHVYFNTKFSR
jgi:hypothetical protein